jgi:hypothetical protein
MPRRRITKRPVNTTDQLSARNPTITDKARRWHHRLIRGLRFVFVPRLAIKPVPRYWDRPIDDTPSKLVFEWQKMPEGYRWF